MSTHYWYFRMDADGCTPLTRSQKSGHPALADLVRRQLAEDVPESVLSAPDMHRAAYWGLGDVAQQLLDEGVDPSERDSRGETPLHKAVRLGRTAAVEALLHSGVDVNAADDGGLTPMHWAAVTGDREILGMLLEHGGDVDSRAWSVADLTPRDILRLMDYEDVQPLLSQREMPSHV